ncbi:putative cyclase [Leucogyrophana mollusca]|uniref:Cyclase n=1 Tax=Leucogyrophana mollusca TaxID=85980 RepID=A0ACB8BUX5_9AGAM|nr:putative cyclase [Leucogyrophana mollusca]
MIDLTHTLTTSAPMPACNGHPTYSATQVSSLPEHDSNVTALSLGSHTGTHIDAPYHFIANGSTVDRLDLQSLVGRAVVVDVRGKKAHEKVTWGDISKCEGKMNKGMIVLICTGWSQYWGEPNYMDHPYLDDNAAAEMVRRGVRVIGVDTMSPDEMNVGCSDHGVHHVVLGAGGAIAENLCNLEIVLEMDEPVVSLLPLKLDSCDGSPIRAVAWPAKETQ